MYVLQFVIETIGIVQCLNVNNIWGPVEVREYLIRGLQHLCSIISPIVPSLSLSIFRFTFYEFVMYSNSECFLVIIEETTITLRDNHFEQVNVPQFVRPFQNSVICLTTINLITIIISLRLLYIYIYIMCRVFSDCPLSLHIAVMPYELSVTTQKSV